MSFTSWQFKRPATLRKRKPQSSRSGRAHTHFRPRLETLEERVVMAAGALDTTFSGDGIVTTSIGAAGSWAHDLAILPDGRLLAAGDAMNGGSGLDKRDFALARYKDDGTLDPTFGSGGIVTTDFKRNFDHINAVAVQADGKTIAGGCTDLNIKNDYTTQLAFALARYNVDGSLDASFGGIKAKGKIVLDLTPQNDVIVDLALQADGKILAVGGSSGVNDTTSNIALARYLSNGTLDTSFGTGGVRTLDLGGLESAQSVVLQSDGKIVIAGLTNKNGTFDFMLARFNSAGVLDPAFGTGGVVTTDIATGGVSRNDKAYNLALQADGKLVVAGVSDQLVLARYNANGALDTTFGANQNGLVMTGMGTTIGPSLALDAGGRIIAVGAASRPLDPSHFIISVARYLPNGSLDSTFGSSGMTTTDVSGRDNDYGNAVAVDGTGRIVVAGVAGYNSGYNGGPGFYFALVRYQADAPLAFASAPQGTATTNGTTSTLSSGTSQSNSTYDQVFAAASIQPNAFLNWLLLSSIDSPLDGGL